MEIPLDVLDYIFGFLRSNSKSLVACSKAHPVFSQAIERHLYYHIVFCADSDLPETIGITGYTLEPSDLIELLTKSPHIANYIHILQIGTTPTLQNITVVLPMLSKLECMILMPVDMESWMYQPQGFGPAVETCLRLSSLRRLHLGRMAFPLYILNNRANINSLSLSGTHTNPEWLSLSGTPRIPDDSEDSNLQLTALSFESIQDPVSFTTWATRHIDKLQSLKCTYSDEAVISSLLGICSDTLSNLDLGFTGLYNTVYDGLTRRVVENSKIPSLDLSSLPHLQHLTIRGSVYHIGSYDHFSAHAYLHISHLPAVVELFEIAPTLQHLTIDIRVTLETKYLSEISFPVFAALAKVSPSFHRIDLYVRGIAEIELVILFGEYGGVTALIEQGILVIHMHETAPGDPRFVLG